MKKILVGRLMLGVLCLGVFFQAQAVTITFDDVGATGDAGAFYDASYGVTFTGGGLLTDGAAGESVGQPVFSNYVGDFQIATLTKVLGDLYTDSYFDIWVNFNSDVTAVSGDYFGNQSVGGSIFAYDENNNELSSFSLSALTDASTVGLLGTFDFGSLTGIRSLHLISDSASAATMLDNLSYSTLVVPVPAAIWLFSSGILGLMAFARRKKS